MKRLFALGLAMATLSAPAFAGGHGDHSMRPWSLSLGAAALYVPEYKGSDEYETLAVPIVRAKYKFDSRNSVFFNGFEGLGYKYKAGNGWAFGLHGKYRRGRDSGDDVFLSGMPDVDDTVEVGPFVQYRLPHGVKLGLSYRTGLDSDNDGSVMDITANYHHKIDDVWRAGLGAKLTYADGDYMSNYYEVTSGQASGARTASSAGAGFEDVSVNGRLTYSLDGHQSLTAMAGYSFLVGDARDSSLSQEDGAGMLMLGWAYKF